jgi:hypothetical protein
MNNSTTDSSLTDKPKFICFCQDVVLSRLESLVTSTIEKPKIGIDVNNTLVHFDNETTLTLLLELIMLELKKERTFIRTNLDAVEAYIKAKIEDTKGETLKCGFIFCNGMVIDYTEFVKRIDKGEKMNGVCCFDQFSILLVEILDGLISIDGNRPPMHADRITYWSILEKINLTLFKKKIFFNRIWEEPKKYIKPNHSFEDLQHFVNETGSSLHLITNDDEDWIQKIMSFCYGESWEVLFETKTYNANKPYYFSTQHNLDIYVGDSLNSDLLPTRNLKYSVFLLGKNPWLVEWYSLSHIHFKNVVTLLNCPPLEKQKICPVKLSYMEKQ